MLTPLLIASSAVRAQARVAHDARGGDVRHRSSRRRRSGTSPRPCRHTVVTVPARADHDAALAAFTAACRRVPDADWHRPPRPGGWSPAAVALHVADAYAYGCRAVEGDTMRMLASPLQAWFGRTILLPLMFATGRFPRGARAPREVAPDLALAATLDRDAALARLHAVAADAATALLDAPPTRRIRHAYVGDLAPHTALRMLAAHTAHHARLLDAATAAAR